MSLKKRMFRSNMMILFSALVALFVVIVLVLVLLEDSFERKLNDLNSVKLERHVGEVARFMEETEGNEYHLLEQTISAYGYQVAIIKDGQVIDGTDSEKMKDLAELFIGELSIPDGAEIFYHQKATIVAKDMGEGKGYLVAADFPEGNWIVSTIHQSVTVLFGALLLIGFGTIAVLLILSSFFTRKLNEIVMEPLEKLLEGAERIQNGNLQEEIQYQGEKEFENVCHTFNEMQKTMLNDQEQRMKNEKARTDMVTGISHDLRTPLTSIQGYIKGVLDGVANTPKKQEFYLKTAYESTCEMNVLLQKLFDFSRMESGQMPFHMMPVDLVEYTLHYVAQKESVLEEVQFSFTSERERMREVLIDVEQVKRIYDNLLENSIKYVKKRPLLIEIALYEEGDMVVLDWNDNGDGVSEEKVDKIFERFYRCDEARSEKGSGVGLYVVKYLMEQHKGSVQAKNNGGFQIKLKFPIADPIFS